MTFTPVESGTRVTLTHDEFDSLGAEGTFYRDRYAGGWPTVLGWYAGVLCDRLEEVALRENPDQAAAVLDRNGADVLLGHPLRHFAERVLRSDLDEVGTHDIGDLRHEASLSHGGLEKRLPSK